MIRLNSFSISAKPDCFYMEQIISVSNEILLLLKYTLQILWGSFRDVLASLHFRRPE